MSDISLFAVLKEVSFMMQADNIFRGSLPNVFLPPRTDVAPPAFVPEGADYACLPMPTGFLFKVLSWKEEMTPEIEKRLNETFNEVENAVASLKLKSMGIPRITNDGGKLNCMLAFDNNDHHLVLVDSREIDISQIPVLWLWRKRSEINCILDWPGVLGSRRLDIDAAIPPASILAGRVFNAFFMKGTFENEMEEARIKRDSLALGRIFSEYPWIARNFSFVEGLKLATLMISPADMKKMFRGPAGEWLELCDMPRKGAWLITMSEINLRKPPETEAADLTQFVKLCYEDFFSGVAVMIGNIPALTLSIVAGAVPDHVLNEANGMFPSFAMGLLLEDNGDMTKVSLGVLSGLPVNRSLTADGLTQGYVNGDEVASFFVDAREMPGLVSIECERGKEIEVFLKLKKRFFGHFRENYAFPKTMGKVLERARYNIAKTKSMMPRDLGIYPGR